MYKIDKSLVDSMNFNKSFIVITNDETLSENVNSKNIDTAKTSGEDIEITPEIKQEILFNASNEAQLIIRDAYKKAEKIKKLAYQQGYDKGMDDANRKLEDEIKTQTEEVAGVLKKLKAYKQNLYKEIQDNLLQLSLDIAEKIVNIQLKRDDKVYVGIVKKAITKLKCSEKFVLQVSRKEYNKYFKDDTKWLQDEIECAPFEVVCDPYMEDGGCIVESDEGIINAGVQIQLNKIQGSLNEKAAQYGQAL